MILNRYTRNIPVLKAIDYITQQILPRKDQVYIR